MFKVRTRPHFYKTIKSSLMQMAIFGSKLTCNNLNTYEHNYIEKSEPRHCLLRNNLFIHYLVR